MSTPSNPLEQLFELSKSFEKVASTEYEQLTHSRRLKHALLANYTCTNGCLLIRLFDSSAGVAYYLPSYRLAPAANAERSSAAGRAAHTLNGDDKWMPRIGSLEHALGFGLPFTVACEHTSGLLIELGDLRVGSVGRPTRGKINVKSGELHINSR